MRYEARFTLTDEDLVTAYRMHKRETAFTRNLYILAGVIAVVLFAVIAHFMQRPQMVVFGLVFGVIAGASPFLIEWRIRSAGKKMKAEEVRCYFSEEGLEFQNKFGQVKYTWDLVVKASLDERGLLFYTGPMSYSFVPARGFVSGYFPRAELRTLLLAKLKNA